MDHGADVVTVVANAVTDISKGILQISAAGLRQLFLMLYEGKSLKAGEINIEKLLRSLDSGEKLNDITIGKDYIDRLVDLSKQHGITYAVAEKPDGEMVVYFPEGQTNRMKHVLTDMQNEINKNEVALGHEGKGAEEFNPEIKESLYNEDISSEKTIVIFDGMNPNRHVRISQQPLRDGGCETRCYAHGEDGITAVISATDAALISAAYDQRMNFEVKGLYAESKIQSHIDKLCATMEAKRALEADTAAKVNKFDSILAENSSLDGSLYIISDAKEGKNKVAIYKHLEPTGGGDFKTVNEVMVFKDGKLTNDIDAKTAILTMSNYKISEKHGRNALTQYEKVISGDLFKDKSARDQKPVEQTGPPLRKSLADYEKMVENVKAIQPQNKDIKLDVPIKAIKDLTDRTGR